jgi:hypothetical protein
MVNDFLIRSARQKTSQIHGMHSTLDAIHVVYERALYRERRFSIFFRALASTFLG